MKPIRPEAIFLSVAMLLFGCGMPGEGDERPPVVEEPPPQVNPPLPDRTTRVGFNRLDQPWEGFRNCGDEAVPAFIRPVSDPDQPPLVDGDLSEWAPVPALLESPAGEVRAGFDIGDVRIQASPADLFFAVRGAVTDAAPPVLYMEAGTGYLDGTDQYQEKSQRYFRVTPTGVAGYFDGGWQDLGEQPATARFGEEGFEFRLSRRFLMGEVVSRQLWWVRFFGGEDELERFDVTSMVYLNTLHEGVEKAFEISACAPERHSGLGIVWQQITDTEVSAAAAARIGAVVRYAGSALAGLLGDHSFPVSSVGILVLRRSGAAVPGFMRDTGSALFNRAVTVSEEDLFGPGGDSPADGIALREEVPTGFPRTMTPEQDIFREATGHLLNIYLTSVNPAAPDSLRETVQTALLSKVVRSHAGTWYWLVRVRQELAEARELLQSGPDARAAEVALGFFLDHYWSAEDLLATWGKVSDIPPEDMPAALIRELGALNEGELAGIAADLTTVWVQGQGGDDAALGTTAAIRPVDLLDEDRDGLPAWLEKQQSLDPGRLDTDGDGWSDLAEFVQGSDGLDGARHPAGIVADGYFGDWQDLLPGRVLSDREPAPEGCPAGGDIRNYAALISESGLVAVVRTTADPGRQGLHFALMVDFPALNRSFRVAGHSGSDVFGIFDGPSNELLRQLDAPWANLNGAWEIDLDFRKLGMPDDITNTPVKLRAEVSFDSRRNIFCDDTPWFDPLLSTR